MGINRIGPSPSPTPTPATTYPGGIAQDPQYAGTINAAMRAMAAQDYQTQKQQRDDACKQLTEKKDDDDDDD